MSIVNTNKLTFFANEGRPLQLGYAYVGQPQLDPQVPANQKDVTFTDSLGNSFPAPQPLRTDNDGRIQWNGKPIIATIDGDYSLLLLDSNKTQINGGWTPTVSAADSNTSDLSNYREYGLLLADIKQVDVSVGETIGNVGKILTTDGLGTDWLVVSPTGSPADDETIINFDNGLQGVRLYPSQPLVSGFASYSQNYVVRSSAPSDSFDVDANIAYNGGYETVGPTGSGADNIWAFLDILPANTKVLKLKTSIGANGSTTNLSVAMFFRETGGLSGGLSVADSITVSAGDQDLIFSQATDYVEVVLDSNLTFEMLFTGSLGFTPSASLKLLGFGV